MRPSWADFEKSIRRSPARRRVLVTLASLSVSHPRPLAAAAEVDHRHLMGILYGRPPKYRVELALIPLGLVREVQGPNGRAFEITERGRRKARQLTARDARKAETRAARRKVHGEVPLTALAGPRAPPPGPPETSSWTFSVTHP